MQDNSRNRRKNQFDRLEKFKWSNEKSRSTVTTSTSDYGLFFSGVEEHIRANSASREDAYSVSVALLSVENWG
jgi:hypothetical protein